MTPGEVTHARDDELSRRRLSLLRRPCPNCDNGFFAAPCTCHEDLAEVELIEAEQRWRERQGP